MMFHTFVMTCVTCFFSNGDRIFLLIYKLRFSSPQIKMSNIANFPLSPSIQYFKTLMFTSRLSGLCWQLPHKKKPKLLNKLTGE